MRPVHDRRSAWTRRSPGLRWPRASRRRPARAGRVADVYGFSTDAFPGPRNGRDRSVARGPDSGPRTTTGGGAVTRRRGYSDSPPAVGRRSYRCGSVPGFHRTSPTISPIQLCCQSPASLRRVSIRNGVAQVTLRGVDAYAERVFRWARSSTSGEAGRIPALTRNRRPAVTLRGRVGAPGPDRSIVQASSRSTT